MNRRTLAILVVPLLFACSSNPGAGNDSATTVAATIYEPDGSEPAAGVTVKLFDAATVDARPVVITVTDDSGRYSFTDLEPGRYAIWAEKDTLVLFRDSIEVTSTSTSSPEVKDDTLEYPSSITGIVRVEPQHEPTTVTIRLLGTAKSFNVSDDNGWFTLTGLASGNFTMMLESITPGYLPTAAAITVAPLSHDTVADTFDLLYTDIPVVAGIRLSQDTVAGTVTIAWNKTSYAGIKDYVIYKDACGAIDLLPEPSHETTDTQFVDPMFASLTASASDTLPRCIRYRVAVRNIAEKIGLTNGYHEIKFAPKYWATTFFMRTARYRGNPFDSVSIDDTIVYTLYAINMTRPLRKLIWWEPFDSKAVAIVDLSDSCRKSFSDSVRYAFHTTGKHFLQAIVIDDAGKEWYDGIMVKTVIDTLAAQAGNDTGVFTGDTVRLHGSAFHRFGTIPVWKWKIGSGDWNAADSDTVFTAPATEQTVLCSLSITDEDGAQSTDTMKLFTSHKVLAVAAGAFHSLIIKTDSTLWTFGDNLYGQLGDGTNRGLPAPVRIMAGVQAMAAGDYHSLILKMDGTAWIFGNNDKGQFGDGTTEGRLTPKRIMSDVQSIAAGGNSSLLLKTDASLWGCGWNPSGQSADSSGEDPYATVLIMNDVLSMAAGGRHLMILKTDGTLWACGDNTYGQLCDGSWEKRISPVQVMTGVRSVSAGFGHTLIVKDDGTLWTCGRNLEGQLGVRSSGSRSTPEMLMDDVQSAVAGQLHSLILKTGGTLWACGANTNGQLGDGSHVNKYSPVLIMSDVQSMAAGEQHSLIVKTDGSLWACGDGSHGQLGNGSVTARPTPVRAIPYLYYQ